jgi:hypothetical protein
MLVLKIERLNDACVKDPWVLQIERLNDACVCFVLSFPEMLSSFLEKAFLSAMSVELMNTTTPIALFTFQRLDRLCKLQ